jgi:23S rRNA (cytosine1962-C5)-methyltransferase
MTASKSSVVLTKAAADSVRRGHPWVWSRGVARLEGGPRTGHDAPLFGPDGAPVGRGVFDEGSPIPVRVWSPDAAESIDGAHVRAKLSRAAAARAGLFGDGETTAYRLLHGEGDRAPGLVIDRYGPLAVLRADGPAAEIVAGRWKGDIVAELQAAGLEHVVVRRAEKGAAPSFEVWAGRAPDKPVVVKEHGVPFVVDVVRGQKTGAFLDQRDNRRRVGAMAEGRRVLNLFSYAGGFSLHAALRGAVRVTSVDSAAAAHGTAQASFRAAGVDPRAHDFVTADAFAFLSSARDRRETWDLVVSDPPSFAPNEKSVPRALAAYRSLHRAAAQVLAPGGTLCAASCSSHVDASAFLSTLDDAAVEPCTLSLRELHGAPPDHPTLAAWPEGRYLKFAVLS